MKQIDFENGKITDNILRASVPMLVAEVLSLLYNIVDRIYIARIPDVGTTALGSVGLCFPIITIILAFSNLFGSGGAPLFSIERGRKDNREASMIMNTSFFLICVCSLILMAVGMIFAKPILILFGSSESGLVYAYPYLMIYLIGTFPSMVSTGMNPFINAQGYATTGMFSVAIGAVANLILDPVFIFVFGLGIRGAAIATVLSQILSASFVLYFLRKRTELKIRVLSPEEIRACGKRAKNIISLGTAGFIMQLTNSLVTICCNNVLSVTSGDLYISVMTIVSSIRQIIDTPIHAVTEGSSPVISYNYGAGNAGRVKSAFKLLLKVSLCYSTILWGAVMLFPEVFAGMFTTEADLIVFTRPALRIYMAVMLIFGIQMACQMTFNALGRAVESIVVAVMRKFILLLPLIYIMPLLFSSNKTMAVYLAEPAADLLAVTFTAILFTVRFKKALQTMENKKIQDT